VHYAPVVIASVRAGHRKSPGACWQRILSLPPWLTRIDHLLGWFGLFLSSGKHFGVMIFAAWTAFVPLPVTADQFFLC
jgi:hypothetical protein